MFKTMALVGIGILAVALIFVAFRPSTFRVERSAKVNAPPDKIFAFINDFKEWPKWSPYEKLDPTMQRTYGGADSGAGATYAWTSDGRAGAGGMEITEASSPTKIVLNLIFTKPFKADNVVTFTLEPQGDATHLTWAMVGPVPYVAKIMHLFFNMDRMIGGDFERGLADLKKVAEQ